MHMQFKVVLKKVMGSSLRGKKVSGVRTTLPYAHFDQSFLWSDQRRTIHASCINFALGLSEVGHDQYGRSMCTLCTMKQQFSWFFGLSCRHSRWKTVGHVSLTPQLTCNTTKGHVGDPVLGTHPNCSKLETNKQTNNQNQMPRKYNLFDIPKNSVFFEILISLTYFS